MKRKEKAEFDSLVVNFRNGAEASFKKAGYDDAEDLAQEVAVRIAAARLNIPRGNFTMVAMEAEALSIFKEVAKEAHSRKRGLKLMDIEAAATVPDVATPHHFLMATEIAGAAVELDLDSHMMGDTLEDEAHHYGVTRQRAHQIINEKRAAMVEFLVD